MSTPSIALFAPHPVLTVTLEVEGGDRQSIHFHAGGQGVWVAGMASAMGARPVLCGLIGGEPGEILIPLVREGRRGDRSISCRPRPPSGCYVTDRRSGKRELLVHEPQRSSLASRARRAVLADLRGGARPAGGWSSPTLCRPNRCRSRSTGTSWPTPARAAAARSWTSPPRVWTAPSNGEPDLVKINDWELAAFVRGPVSHAEPLLAAARSGCASGGEARDRHPRRAAGPLPAGRRRLGLTPPRFEHGFREGCGDAMMGALAAAWAGGDEPSSTRSCWAPPRAPRTSFATAWGTPLARWWRSSPRPSRWSLARRAAAPELTRARTAARRAGSPRVPARSTRAARAGRPRAGARSPRSGARAARRGTDARRWRAVHEPFAGKPQHGLLGPPARCRR